MDPNILERIERAKQLLSTASNAAMATVNADGSPHNTPFFFIRDKPLTKVYWSSQSSSLHCQNALRTGQIFVVVYEANQGGGLYIDADCSKELSGSELQTSLEIHNAMRVTAGKDALPVSYFTGTSPQRMYSATPRHIYINASQRDASGKVMRDYRHEISLKDLRS